MDRSAATSSQADCVLRLIFQICKRTNLQMDIYQRAIVIAEAEGYFEDRRDLQRLMRIAEADRKMLNGLVAFLQSRSAHRGTHENVSLVSRRARLADFRGPRRAT